MWSNEVDIQRIRSNIEGFGFCAVNGLFTESDLAESEKLIDELMHSSGRVVRKLRREMAENPPEEVWVQPELSRPAMLSTKLRKSPVFETCQTLAANLFEARAHYLFDHAIYKMPRTTATTPWHQDQAYLGEHVHSPSIHFWIPFQQVSEHNGAMRFATDQPGHLLPHGPAFASNPHLLAVSAPPTDFHSANLQRGGASLHTNLTLHGTGPNPSDEIRKAWVIHFGRHPAWHKRVMQLKARWKK
ncbi:MAG: hypothetical protein EA349_09780 [Halomonadaceae bacterium]|nr:MAG: hypothetical protein EA349_09780 [Halomonadaceae bacterium]